MNDPDCVALSTRLAREPFTPMSLSAHCGIPEGEAFAMLLKLEEAGIVRRCNAEGAMWEWVEL